MSNRNIGSGSKNDLIDSYNELVEITNGMRESAYQSAMTGANVVKELPTIVNKLQEKDVPEKDIDRVMSIANTIAKDTDKYLNELKTVDDRFSDDKRKSTKSAKVANKNYTKVLMVSSSYADISSRLTETTTSLVDDFTDVCLELGVDDEFKEAEEAEEASNVEE